MSPKVYIEERLAQRAELLEQLRQLEDHRPRPEQTPTLGTHMNNVSDIEESIARVKAKIAETDRLIASVGNPDA